jgi:hypothetical protein
MDKIKVVISYEIDKEAFFGKHGFESPNDEEILELLAISEKDTLDTWGGLFNPAIFKNMKVEYSLVKDEVVKEGAYSDI